MNRIIYQFIIKIFLLGELAVKRYGYARISKPTQDITRQIRNLEKVYGKSGVEIFIIEEAFTGTKIQGRAEFNRLMRIVEKEVKNGESVLIAFDSVSRMSRNAQEGVEVYFQLFDMGIELEFLKEPHINTSVYRSKMGDVVSLTGDSVDVILSAINEYMRELAKEQIIKAFEQAEKEVTDLHQRVKEGMRVKKELYGHVPGPVKGSKHPRKNKEEKKAGIRKYSRAFGGTLKDEEVMKLVGISSKTYYLYKKELYQELAEKVEA